MPREHDHPDPNLIIQGVRRAQRGLYTPPPTPPESGRLQKAKIAENDHVTHGPTFLAGVHGLRGLWWTQPRLNMEKLPALLATIYIYLPNP